MDIKNIIRNLSLIKLGLKVNDDKFSILLKYLNENLNGMEKYIHKGEFFYGYSDYNIIICLSSNNLFYVPKIFNDINEILSSNYDYSLFESILKYWLNLHYNISFDDCYMMDRYPESVKFKLVVD